MCISCAILLVAKQIDDVPAIVSFYDTVNPLFNHNNGICKTPLTYRATFAISLLAQQVPGSGTNWH